MLSPRLALPALLACVAVPTGVAAAQSDSLTAPSYPQSRLAVKVSKEARAASTVTVTVTGTNALFGDNPTAAPAYTVNVFVQDPSQVNQCPRTYDQARQNLINLGTSAVMTIVSEANVGKEGPFTYRQKYRAGARRKVIYCAYTRLITDDVAVAAYRKTLRKPKRR